MMPGWFKKLFGICFGGFIAFGFLLPQVKADEEVDTISIAEINAKDCVKTSLIDIFFMPKLYVGERVCFRAYIYYSPRLTGSVQFHAAPVQSFEEKKDGEVAYLDDYANVKNKIYLIPIGSPVYVVGNLENIRCLTLIDEECFPNKKAIFLTEPEIYLFK